MVISTLDTDAFPASRVVLVKGITPEGLQFFTNYNSRKGQQLSKHPKIAVTFHWGFMGRQVNMQGTTYQLSPEESDAYWKTRPRLSQISQLISKQSQTLESRAQIEEQYQQMLQKFENEAHIPRPAHWGGFFIKPHRIEFWTAHPHRLHERVLFQNINGQWQSQLLYP